jgi:nucleoside phosphorylase
LFVTDADPALANAYIRGNMRIGGTYTCSANPDLAENIPHAVGLARALEPGDVVVVDQAKDENMTLSSRPYDPTVLGIISTQPGVLLGAEQPGKAVALVGRVPTKVTAENGPIRRGDLMVTSSKPGYAMRADPDKVKPGTVLGKALGELVEGEGTIVVMR